MSSLAVHFIQGNWCIPVLGFYPSSSQIQLCGTDLKTTTTVGSEEMNEYDDVAQKDERTIEAKGRQKKRRMKKRG